MYHRTPEGAKFVGGLSNRTAYDMMNASMEQSSSLADDLRRRLEQLGVSRGLSPSAAPPSQPEARTSITWIEGIVTGDVVVTPLGPCFVTDEVWSGDAEHGSVALAAIHAYADGVPAALAQDDDLGDFDFGATAFIDTETSGLAGGAGTFAFLVGVGFFDGPDFRVRQFFMRDPGEEPALIHLLDTLLQGFDSLVSFNGKAFDVPLLQTRFVMSRRQFPLQSAPHLDLLSPARRLWSARLSSCSLTSLEERILGFFREGDVPGWMIPSLYFEYARTGDAAPLRPVFSHNALDILSMVSLSTRMAEWLTAPETAEVTHGADWYSLGRCYERLGWIGRAADAYSRALTAPCAPAIRHRSHEHLSFLYKRQAQWDVAVKLWEDLVDARTADRLYPYEELAKYYEHRRREYGQAIQLVREAIERIETRELRPRRPRQHALAELRHRLGRLERKSAKQKPLR